MPPLTAEQRRMVESAAAMVARLVGSAARRWPELSHDELLSIANEAVVNAARAFDPSRGVPFEAYAYRRVRGDLRRIAGREALGHFARVMAVFHADERAAEDSFEPPDLAEALQDEAASAYERATHWARKEAASLIAAALLAEGPRPAEEQFLAREDEQQKRTAFERAVEALPGVQRRFVELYYRRGLRMADVAAELGCSTRNAGRLHEVVKRVLARELARCARARSAAHRSRRTG